MKTRFSFTSAASLLILIISLQAVAAQNLIELSSVPETFTGEGVTYSRLVFKDDKRQIFYQPPNGWKISSSSSQLSLVPEAKSLADAKIESLPAQNPSASTSPDLLKQQVLASLPPGSVRPEIVRQEQNAVLLDNRPSTEVVVTFEAFGQRLQRSVLLVGSPANEIRFQLTALKRDFDALYGAFRSSVLTWQWQSVPSDTAPGTDAATAP